MENITVDISNVAVGVSLDDVLGLLPRASEANVVLCGGGVDMTGWVGLPSHISASDTLMEIEREAVRLHELADIVVVIGIGGSYLGSKTVLDALGDPFAELRRRSTPRIVFAGQNLDEDYLYGLFDAFKDRDVAAIVVSKSGTTIEPAIAFRLIRQLLERRYGTEGAAQRIVAITDAQRGLLKTLADHEGYRTFVIPDNIGGRYSVLTPVGLLPVAVAGIDVGELIRGARDMEAATAPEVAPQENPALVYAAARNVLYKKGYKIEILAACSPSLTSLVEWWKQLFGESEGKQGQGIFPAGATYTTDLHSLGQYVQQGERHIFETLLSVAAPRQRVEITTDPGDPDQLNYLAGRRLSEINRMARLGTTKAHTDGGVPNLTIEIPRLDAYWLGALFYFFEKSCAISGLLLGVDPFDQPGVEDYKRNMFALLGK